MDHVYDLDGPALLECLKDTGRRKHRRFRPPEDAPVRVSVRGQSDWRLGARLLEDISLGGFGLHISAREAKSVKVGELVAVQLELPTGLLMLRAHAMHLSSIRSVWRSQWHLGLMFAHEATSVWSRQQLIDYLLTLAARPELAA